MTALRKLSKQSAISLSLLALSSTTPFLTAHADEAFSKDSRWMLGDWDGTRQKLLDDGYSLIGKYVGETATNIHGGYDKNSKFGYADQFVFGLNVDLQKTIGLNNADVQLFITDRNGSDFTADRLPDPRTGQVGSSMEVAGRGQIWRVSQLWFHQVYLNGAVDLKVGRGSPSEDFQSFPCDFQNLSFCSAQAGVWAADDWYSFPVSVWGTRVKVQVAPELYLQVGAYEHNRTELEHDNGFKMSTSGANGVNVPIELLWTPQHALLGLPGEYRLGAYHINMRANDIFEDANGQPRALTGAAPRTRSERTGVWLMARQQIAQFGSDSNRPVEVFAQAHANDRNTSFVDRFYSAGIVATGAFDSRPKDQIGLAVSSIHVNSKIREAQQLLNQSSGASTYSDPEYVPLQGTEYDSELYYGIHATNWLTIRPNIQFVHNPGAVKQVDDAWVGGLKIVTQF
ncbi:carbohydrate porin [Pseudomonas gingeri]|nr:carbohydrate porin [Pseudomonas gingeri]